MKCTLTQHLNINKLGVTFFNKVKHISGTKH